MTKRLKTAGVLAAILTLTGFVLAASVARTAASKSGHQRRVIHVAEKSADDVETFVDVGEEDLSVGDYTVFTNDPIYNASRSRQIGSANVDCLVVRLGPRDDLEIECDASFTLAGGLITSEGPIDFSRRVNVWAVTGGTEAFKTAHGTLRVTQEEPGLDLLFVLQL
jgi:hypothetical protein